MYLSLYCKVSVGVEDCNILTSPAPPDIAVCRSRSPDAQPEARGLSFLLVFSTTTYHQLVSNSLGVLEPPSAGRWLSLPHLDSNFSGLQLTDFLSSPSYIIVQSPIQSPTQSLEWHVWLSSSGNNCHAVQRSLSQLHQSMSVSWSFTLSHFVSQIRLRDFFRLLIIGMCHFLPVHHFGMACSAGSKVNIQQKNLSGRNC